MNSVETETGSHHLTSLKLARGIGLFAVRVCRLPKLDVAGSGPCVVAVSAGSRVPSFR
jgi:hypothetical protein